MPRTVGIGHQNFGHIIQTLTMSMVEQFFSVRFAGSSYMINCPEKGRDLEFSSCRRIFESSQYGLCS